MTLHETTVTFLPSCSNGNLDRLWKMGIPYFQLTITQYIVLDFQNPIHSSVHTRTFSTADEVCYCNDRLLRKQCIRQQMMQTLQAKMIGNEPYIGIRIGEAKHPGPENECNVDVNMGPIQTQAKRNTNPISGYKLHVANVTNLLTNAYLLAKRQCNALIVSEHSIKQFQQSNAKHLLGGNCKLRLSELDPESSHNLGGLGLVNFDQKHVINTKAVLPELQEIIGKGRVDLFCLEPIKNQFILIYAIYGYTNGDACPESAARTDDIIALCFSDSELRPYGPKLITGDLNASVGNLPHLEEAIKEGQWVDIGARATVYGAEKDNQPTCKATSESIATRKDYAIANEAAEQLIQSFRLDDTSGIPVHSIIEITFKDKAPIHKYDAVSLPGTIQEVFLDKCKKAYGEGNRKNAALKQEAKDKACKKYTCNINRDDILPKASSTAPIFPPKKIKPQNAATLIQKSKEDIEQLEKDFHDNLAESNFTNDQLTKQKADLHKCMDDALEPLKHKFNKLLQEGNTERYIKVFSAAIEQATADFGELDSEAYQRIAGRSKVNVKVTKDRKPAAYIPENENLEMPCQAEAARTLRQYRRLLAIRGCSNKLSKDLKAVDNKLEPARVTKICEDIICNIKAFQEHYKDVDEQNYIIQHLKEKEHNNLSFFILTRAIDYYKLTYDNLHRHNLKRQEQLGKQAFKSKKSHSFISKCLKGTTPAPMSCLARDQNTPEGLTKGSLTTDPKEIDQILVRTWAQIFRGNGDEIEKIADDFMKKYEPHIEHSKQQWEIGDLQFEDFKQICHAGSDSAAGLDGWAARDLTLLSDNAIQLLVDFLNAIEKGAPWPEHMLQTRAVFLSKDPDNTANPLAYRILKITSGLYRKWASCRNRNLEGWIKTWDCEAINSGVPGKGAQDAWQKTAIANELTKLMGQHISGGSIDVFKCFDQINRKLLYKLAKEAGMPTRILEPYFAYIDNLQIRFQIGKTIGSAHRDRCSIPQGCPFSMTMVSLILKPWINYMIELGVEPRVLADDLMITATGDGNRTKTIQAMQASRMYFHDIGAKVTNNKCFTFATDPIVRNELARFVWDDQGTKIPNLKTFRDLGAHMNLTSNANGATLTARMKKATKMARRLKWMPIPREAKYKIVMCNILPAALYGVEITSINKGAMQELRSAVASAIGPASAKRSIDLTFNTTSTAKDLDPLVHSLYLRAANLRRIMAKSKDAHDQVWQIIAAYNLHGMEGQADTPVNVERLRHLKLINAQSRYKQATLWQNITEGNNTDGIENCDESAHGPVGLLINQLQECGYELNNDLVATAPGEIPVDIWNIPWQHLKPAIMSIAVRKRNAGISSSRTFCGDFNEIEIPIMKSVVNSLAHVEQKIHAHISSGAFWHELQLKGIQRSCGKCKHCGEDVTSTDHVLYECSVINKHRTNKTLSGIKHTHLHKAIRNNIPVAMTQRMHGCFWDDGPAKGDINDPFTEKLCGFQNGRANTSIAECHTIELHNVLKEKIPNPNTNQTINARQTFQLLKQTGEDTIFITPPKCSLDAPDVINTYSDGSWLFPKQQFLALGGAGVWWPGRTLTNRPLSVAEQAIAWHKVDSDGIRLYAKIGGYAGSSTRTEIAAGIISVCANGPVHIGSDSEVFVGKAKCIIAHIRAGHVNRCNWKLVSDGDLLEQFYKHVEAKGARAVNITWVKGHATDQHVQDGITTEEHKIGNKVADEVADLGTALHGEDFVKVAKRMSNRHHWYLQLMLKISKHTIEAYKIHRILTEYQEEIDGKVEKEQENKRVSYIPLIYPNESETRNVDNYATIYDYSNYTKCNNCAHNIEHFLANIQVKETGQSERGITWVELYVIYRLRGNPAPYTTNERKAANKKTAWQQIKEFTRQMRGNITRTLTSEDQMLFKPHTKQDRCMLKQIAINGDLPAINCNVSLYEGEQESIAEALVHLSRHTAKKNCKEFVQQTKQLMPVNLKLNGKANWDATIDSTNRLNAQARLDMRVWKKENTHKDETISGYFQCPKCEHVEHSSCPSFQTVDLDVKQKCNGCISTSRVAEWKCTCGYTWHNCDVHRHHKTENNTSTKSKQKREHTSENMAKQPVIHKAPKLDHNMPVEQMLAQETQRAKRKRQEEDEWIQMPSFELGIPRIKSIRVASLGPNLRMKFKHPGGL